MVQGAGVFVLQLVMHTLVFLCGLPFARSLTLSIFLPLSLSLSLFLSRELLGQSLCALADLALQFRVLESEAAMLGLAESAFVYVMQGCWNSFMASKTLRSPRLLRSYL